MRQNSIFESVTFLNDEPQFIIEAVLDEDEVLNEAVILKYVKKEDVPDEFQDLVVKICEQIEKESGGVKGTEGIWATSFTAGFGIRLNNAVKKIKKSKKNCYTVRFPYKAVRRATGTEKKFKDLFIRNLKLVFDYCQNLCKKNGFKKVSSKPGTSDAVLIKEGKDCIYSVQFITNPNDASATMQFGCLKDTEDNRTLLSGEKYI